MQSLLKEKGDSLGREKVVRKFLESTGIFMKFQSLRWKILLGNKVASPCGWSTLRGVYELFLGHPVEVTRIGAKTDTVG